jgi:hypothetical protein
MKRFILINTIALAGFLTLFLSSALAQGGPGHTLMHQHYNVILKHDNGNKHIAHGHCEVHHANGGGHYFPTSEKGEGRLVGHPGAALSCIHGDHMFWGHIPKKGPHNNIVMKAIPLDIWGQIAHGAKRGWHGIKKDANDTKDDANSIAHGKTPDNARRNLGICKNKEVRKRCQKLNTLMLLKHPFNIKEKQACATDNNCNLDRGACMPKAGCE